MHPDNDNGRYEKVLFQYAEFFTHFDKGSDTFVEMSLLVSCRDLHTDTRLFLRNHRIIESGHVNTLFLHTCSINLRQLRIIQHHSAYRTLRRFDIKSGSGHLVAEVIHVLYELVVQRIAFFQHFEYFKAGADNTRSQ